MKTTKIVTSFLTQDDKYLILKRSNKVRTMKELWAGISGIIEGNEEPLYRAKKEIHEETNITEDQITLIRTATQMRIDSPQYKDHEWLIFPFLFSVREPKIRLNWENSDYQWITIPDLVKFQTVPSLEKVLTSLL
ncbi:MAG: NUDIX domain-containing protein [Nitrososphaera sp.]